MSVKGNVYKENAYEMRSLLLLETHKQLEIIPATKSGTTNSKISELYI